MVKLPKAVSYKYHNAVYQVTIRSLALLQPTSYFPRDIFYIPDNSEHS